jgi:hypothetical protein
MRDRLGLRPGDEELDGRAVRVEPASSGRPSHGRLRRYDLVGALETDRRREPR